MVSFSLSIGSDDQLLPAPSPGFRPLENAPHISFRSLVGKHVTATSLRDGAHFNIYTSVISATRAYVVFSRFSLEWLCLSSFHW